jgi:hypothetical protein
MNLKILKYGMSIHPGNSTYVFLQAAMLISGIINEKAPWFIGFFSLPILLPMYILTSYSVGKANWDYKNDKPK